MKHWIWLASASTLLASTSVVSAQVLIRAPFVRVQVGDPGVYVNAPFTNIGIPAFPGYYPPPPPYGPVVAPPVGVIPIPRSSATLTLPAPPPTTVEPAPLEIAPNPRPLPQVGTPQPPPAIPNIELPQQQTNPDLAPPAPIQAAKVPSIEEFARSFQPRAGVFEVTLLNPVTRVPTQVRFALPEGAPRVNLRRDEIEFRYSLRQFVRIEFDRDGAMVTSR